MRLLSPPLSCLALIPFTALASAAPKFEPIPQDRIEYWSGLLPESPQGVGRPIADRQAWSQLASSQAFKSAIRTAERLAAEPIPELKDDAFLDFSRTGNRTRGQAVIGARRQRIPALALAECLEARGRFLNSLEAAMRAICAEKTWVMPAHDRLLRNFEGKLVDIDLWSSAVSWELATAAYWLGDRLSPDVRRLIAAELERRCFAPYRAAVVTGKQRIGWLRTTNNWNAVCLAGVTGAALAAIESRRDRALFAAAAEKYVQNFLSGFTPDGYCSEGLGYWNYGFGHYVLLAETLRQATGQRVDWMDNPHVRQVALFARRIEILPGLSPAFADCGVGARGDRRTMAFLSRCYGWGLADLERAAIGPASGPGALFEVGLMAFPVPEKVSGTFFLKGAKRASQKRFLTPFPGPGPQGPADRPLRDWFSDAGILICRPGPGGLLGAALKGGHNAEHHNHNDVGSFVVALGKATPLVDPGAEVYTARTFNEHRYESNALNSFGHPVPRVAGRLQRTGRDAQAKVLEAKFSEAVDRLVLDIRSPYDVPGLAKLQRTFVFDRTGPGSLTVTDEVDLSQAQTFGTALITYSKWRPLAPGQLIVGDAPDDVEVRIAAEGSPFELHPEEIREDMTCRQTPTRLGIELQRPVQKARVTITIRPAG